ncbi:hypothetical protein B566_EDAN007382 [Ephemera danica]|nr:hypothetical protein B566_EDAN007382 [Ephemera danica]
MTCVLLAGRSSADLTLTVKPRPGVFPNSEEVERPTGPTSRQINNQVDPLGFGSGNVGPGGVDTGSDAAYGHMGEAREPPQPFNTLEDHSHELGGPPLLPRSTPRPSWQDRSTSRKHQQHRLEDQEYGSNLKPGSSGYGGSESPVSLASPQPPAVPPPPHEEDLSFPSSSSAAARPMPHFQRLLASFQNLWPFQSFSNSRGHRMVAFDDAKASALADTHGFERHYEDNDDDRPGPIVILGKGSKENLKFEWVAKPWSKCSQSCGGNGYQPNLCLDAGLDPPSAHQSCGHEECPRWIPGSWTPCELSRCFTWNTAMQRRDVSCVFPNGSSAENTAAQCNERNKPPQRQECYNDKCKGTWKVGEWYEYVWYVHVQHQCSAACEAQGIKYRILQCVWFGTKRPAGNACRDQPRPAVMKVCKGPPCKPMAECRDQSNHCKRVKAMNLCRVYSYQYQCCQTCRGTSPPGG